MNKIDVFEKQFQSLNTNRRGEFIAPHKPILLLTILELVRSGKIETPTIKKSKLLKQQFALNWSILVDTRSPYCANFDTPFTYLNNEPFWKTVDSNTAQIDSELFSCMKDRDNNVTLVKVLLQKYFSESSSEAQAYITTISLQQTNDSVHVSKIAAAKTSIDTRPNKSATGLSGRKSIPTKRKNRKNPLSAPLCSVCKRILDSRELTLPTQPLWKLSIKDGEYDELKEYIQDVFHEEANRHSFSDGLAAALYYAEWWRREYSGGIPSKEEIAKASGIPENLSMDFFNAARKTLMDLDFKFIRTSRTEYFRTLLLEGGLPINRIINNENAFNGYTRFLKMLVKEVACIDFDFDMHGIETVKNMSCSNYLSNSYKTDEIFELSLQIAKAIILEDDELLPYDSNNQDLQNLTNVLKSEYKRARVKQNAKPFSFSWALVKEESKTSLRYTLECAAKISSKDIPNLDINECTQFAVFVSNRCVARYKRISFEENEYGTDESEAIYQRIDFGATDFEWDGDVIIGASVCYNDTKLSLSVPNGQAPDFSYPTIFKKSNETTYVQESGAADVMVNLAVFSEDWIPEEQRVKPQKENINGQQYYAIEYQESIVLVNKNSGERISCENMFTPYIIDYIVDYIDWIEHSNYKLIRKAPIIRVYDENRNLTSNFESYYREKGAVEWIKFKNNVRPTIPCGLIEMRIVFPDKHEKRDTFYSIGDLEFESQNEDVQSTKIVVKSCSWGNVFIEKIEGLTIQNLYKNTWQIERDKSSELFPITCTFHISKASIPTLKIETPIPFDGLNIIDINGQQVPSDQIIPFASLNNYKICCFGKAKHSIGISHSKASFETGSNKKVKGVLKNGLYPLSDYSELIQRFMALYGCDYFNRESAVEVYLDNKKIFVRKFVEDTTFQDDRIQVLSIKESISLANNPSSEDDKSRASVRDTMAFRGHLLAVPLGESIEEFDVYALEQQDEDTNLFSFPEDFPSRRSIVFSDSLDIRRVIPKFYDFDNPNIDNTTRTELRQQSIDSCKEELSSDQDLAKGEYWKKALKSFEIASKYNLPFSTFNCLNAIAGNPELLANFILTICLNNKSNELRLEISRFEEEFAISVHWIKRAIWQNIIEYIFQTYGMVGPDIAIMLFAGLRELYDISIGVESSSELCKYLNDECQLSKRACTVFTNSEIDEYKSKAVGVTMDGKDLPVVGLNVVGEYFSREISLGFQKMFIYSPICVAEMLMDINGCYDLWDAKYLTLRRCINFYRTYFRKQYGEILINTIKIILERNK